jgi:hypothetical protein
VGVPSDVFAGTIGSPESRLSVEHKASLSQLFRVVEMSFSK